MLRVNLGELERIATALAARREVRYVSATSGFSDLACEVILRSADDLYDFTTNVLGGLAGVQRTVIAHELATVQARLHARRFSSTHGERKRGRERGERHG